ncbi:MAG: M61 family metallopeptidase [Synoicihabitans sp.]
MRAFLSSYLVATGLMLLGGTATAADTLPKALPIPETIPEARDIPYPRTLTVSVDATDLQQRIYFVEQTVPVAGPGKLTLMLPKWIPAKHRVFGSIRALAGLTIRHGDTIVPWKRDDVDVYAFHLDVPAGAQTLDLAFQFLSPTEPNQGRVVTTPDMLNLQWWDMVLYPAGYYTRQIKITPSVKFPVGWEAATALDLKQRDGSIFHYHTTTVDTLVDSPMFAGRYYRHENLQDNVNLHLFADKPEELAATDEQIETHRELVRQASLLFGGQHYGEYEFLVAISDTIGGIGLEHQSSSENQVDPGYFTQWEAALFDRDLLSHELVHSWNGKYRRPADMWTADFRTPMRDNLLWVYEGQTQFWGYILAARSGMMTKEETLGMLASTAARFDQGRPGRTWRPLADTTLDPVIASRQPKGWSSWQRSEDYYSEGLLIWLDADSLIREATGGKKSLDDFARNFFGVNDGDLGQLTYTFDDVVAELNMVHAFDWEPWLRQRVEQTSTRAPLDGLERGGYRLVFTDERPTYSKSAESRFKYIDLAYSLGLSIDNDGDIGNVVWDSIAFDAGLAKGNKILAVNGRAYEPSELKKLIKAKSSPLKLLVKAGDLYRDVEINYTGGLRYPTLEKIGDTDGWLDILLAPRD